MASFVTGLNLLYWGPFGSSGVGRGLPALDFFEHRHPAHHIRQGVQLTKAKFLGCEKSRINSDHEVA